MAALVVRRVDADVLHGSADRNLSVGLQRIFSRGKLCNLCGQFQLFSTALSNNYLTQTTKTGARVAIRRSPRWIGRSDPGGYKARAYTAAWTPPWNTS
jgi:hypothetical protein